jgi:hypothetical protein
MTAPLTAPRFFDGYQWRFIFADIPTPGSGGATGGATTTWANGLITNRQIVLTLDDSSVISGDVWPDDRQVNEIAADGYPLVAQTKRIVYAFRREGAGSVPRPAGYSSTAPWVIRAAGILMLPEDQADTDVPLTHFTAYDPWKLLEARPAVTNADTLPDAYGFHSWGTWGLRGDQVIGGALKSTINSSLGGFAFIDAGTTYGGTSHWGGTIENCAQIIVDVQQGMSVADVWRQVIDAGCADIILTPIYDPVNRPGYTHELSIYNLAGNQQPTAVVSWDQLNRSASNIDRLHDATPGNFANVVQYYVGSGGPPAPIQINNAAVADFGYYWSTQFFPSQSIPSGEVVAALAQQALYMSRQGKRSVTLNLTPERSPITFLDYNLADFIPVYATKRLRVAMTDSFAADPIAAFRVQTIPITITDDGTEEVTGLLVSPDWRQALIT